MSADVHAWAKKSEADFKLWLKTILSPTDFNVYSKDEVDAAHTAITNRINTLEIKMDIGDATVSEFVDEKIETAFSNMAKAEEVAW
jgi:3-phosphoglycerate kinase